MDAEQERIKALIESLRERTNQLTKEVEALRKLARRSEDRRIDKLFRRRGKPREPQGRASSN